MLVPGHLNLDGLRIVSSVAGNDPGVPAVHSRSHPCRLPVVGEGSQEKRISWNKSPGDRHEVVKCQPWLSGLALHPHVVHPASKTGQEIIIVMFEDGVT